MSYTYAQVTFSGVDYSKEPFSINLNLKVPIDADGNFDAVGAVTLFDMITNPNNALRLAIENIMIADITHTAVMVGRMEAQIVPTDKWAQREIRAKVKVIDQQWNKKFEFSIPCVDWDAVVKVNTDKVNMDLVQIIALKAALETYCCTPYQNSFVVDDMELIGRPG